MTAFPKFGWMAAVAQDDRLPLAARVILPYIANQSVHGGDDWFSVRQKTVAGNLHMHVNTVANAIKSARQLGWLKLAAERQRGRGYFQADIYYMTHPEIGTPWSTSSDEERPTPSSGSSEKYPHVEVEIPTPSSAEDPHVEVGIPTRSNAPTSEKTPLQGIYPGYIPRV